MQCATDPSSSSLYIHTRDASVPIKSHADMESRKPRTNNHRPPINRSKRTNEPCKKHPKHRQSPGVCSICLTERLSQVAKTSAKPTTKYRSYSSSSSSSCSYLSSLSSSCSSPVMEWETRGKSARAFGETAARDVLKKSRSTAFILQRRKKNDDEKNIESSSKRGFWSKLLPRRSKGLMRSRTTRERVITEVH